MSAEANKLLTADLIRARADFENAQTRGFSTGGGSYVIQSCPLANDDDQYHDLAVIDAWGNITPLSPLVNLPWLEGIVKGGEVS
jgi:hypothetical protein